MRYWKCIKIKEGDERSFTLNKIYTTDNYGYNLVDDKKYTFNALNVTQFFSKFEEIYTHGFLPPVPETPPITSITFSTIESILDREYPNGWQIV